MERLEDDIVPEKKKRKPGDRLFGVDTRSRVLYGVCVEHRAIASGRTLGSNCEPSRSSWGLVAIESRTESKSRLR